MEFHHAGRPRGGTQLPSINIVRGPSAPFEPQSPSMAMPRSNYMPSPRGPAPISIRGSEDYTSQAPPPLPPPRRPMDDPHEHHSPRYASGSLSGAFGSISDERPDYTRRPMHRDEGYESFGSTNRSLPGLGSLHAEYRRKTDISCDNMMKNKLNPIRTIDSPSSRRTTLETRLPPLTVPQPILEESGRFTGTPLHSAISPRSGQFHSFRGDSFRSEYMSPESSDYSPRHRSSRKNSGSYPDTVSTQGSFDNTHEVDEMEIDGPSTQSMRRLRIIDDYSSAVPMKRRASSPPAEDAAMTGMTTPSDLLRRREHHSRRSPTPRLSNGAKGSMASPHPASFASPSNGPPSSLGSFGRRSPGTMSPGAMSPITSEASCNSPFQSTVSLNPSPRGSMSRHEAPVAAVHQRKDSRTGLSPRKLADAPKVAPGHKMQEFFMCECCPKKPKKFDTKDELKAHEAEKQYGCLYCGNRFKNKNEAERHQNSLHVRRHSWSCKAMTSYNQAFHDSAQRPGDADTCGYCGKEFERTGPAASLGGRLVADKDWEDRIQHLTETHKFRECNSSKKFYRADHFRQHLKHSHAGSSGKWTNMLENACMVDEEPPQPPQPR